MNAVGELGATLNAALVVIGDRLGLYKAMAGAGALTPARARGPHADQRALRARVAQRPGRGRLRHLRPDGRYTLPAEHALALADEDSPAFLPGAFQLMTAAVRDEPKIAEAFHSGAGVGWHEHSHDLFEGCERFFRPGYQHNLVQSWIPALDGVEDKLRLGARVADVGCGHGASTLIMAEAYPASDFRGFDYHGESIARRHRRRPTSAPGSRSPPRRTSRATGYDLVTTFDCLHDMGDPVGAAAPHPRSARRRRHVADRRAVRRRHGRGEPEPGRPRLLRRLDARLHARVALAGGRPRARRPGGRGAPARRRHRRRLHPLPPRRRDAVQPGARGAPVSRSARTPTTRATSTRDGVRLFYEVYGDGRRTRSCCSRRGRSSTRAMWKAQIAYLARHFRVITFDGRGNGKSDRPNGVAAYTEARVRGRRAGRPGRHADRARRSSRACRAARCGRRCWPPTTPSACAAWPTSGPPCRSRPTHPERAICDRFEEDLRGATSRWAMYNRHYWREDYRGLPGVLLRPDVQRAALDQADRGLRRAGRWRPTPRRSRTRCRRSPCAGWSRSRTRSPACSARCWSSTATTT